MSTMARGRSGEALAAEYMRRKGYAVTGMNWRCRFGEIDLIAENRKFIVFVEVKLRRSGDFARAAEYVDERKIKKLRTSASLYLASGGAEKQPRFDVIEIYDPENGKREINHIEDAF